MATAVIPRQHHRCEQPRSRAATLRSRARGTVAIRRECRVVVLAGPAPQQARQGAP
eukprot:CAMPEP_0185553594 /NCGR_PEP_ID=MMETSP1381-20130426/38446_1 /TAXON_ID=298111 /ORGANISM="Pavlova sp., Strain CCMP459" /LENGTH=55 /DNA_ID=CAMNT_0028166717 /DNA_START=59 /DNA_END=222 /DNA_ORIENTATION=+